MGVHSISPAQFSSQLEASKRVRIGDDETKYPFSLLEEDQGESLALRKRGLSLGNKHANIKEGKLPY